MEHQENRKIDCLGRFSDLTSKLEEALSVVSTSPQVSFQNLKDAYTLLEPDLSVFDPLDPYFNSSTDLWRPKPIADTNAHLDLVPLTRRPLEDSLPLLYAERVDAPRATANVLGNWHKKLDLNTALGLRLDDKLVAYRREKGQSVRIGKGKEMPVQLSKDRASLRGYTLRSSFGLGPAEGDVVVPDAPYTVSLIDPEGKLALVTGFLYTRANTLGTGPIDTMVLGQIQQPRGANIPGNENGQLGIVGHEIAKLVAKGLGLQAIQTYSAERHPMFYQHPERKAGMKGEFKGLYDASAKALGFQGSPSTNYALHL